MTRSTINSRSIEGIHSIDATGIVTAAGLTVDTDTLHIDSTNNRVGIGRTSLNYKFEVSSASDVAVGLYNSSSVTSGNRATLASLNSDASSVGYIRFGAVTDNVGTDIQFGVRPAGGSLTEAMRIDSSGNVGIGTPTTGSYRFNALRADGNLAFFTDGTTADLFIKATAGVSTISPTTGVLALGTSSTERMRIDSSGRVGIGTSSPSQRLHIQGSAVQFTNTQNSYLQINTTDTHLYTAGSHPLRFGTNSIERLNIQSDGNVTISGAGIPASSGAAGRYFDTYNLGTDATSFAIHRLITNNVAGTGTTSADIYKRKNGEFTIANFETDPAAYINFHVGTQPRMRIDSSGITTLTALKPDKYQPVYGPIAITGGFVNGAAINTWHAITNVNINGYLGGYITGQKGLIIEIYWTSGNTSLGYNHTVRLAIPANGSNTFSGYSSGNFSSFQISGNHYDELPSTTVHHTSLTATHNIRFRLRNTTGVSYDPLRLEINASTVPNAANAYITIWRA